MLTSFIDVESLEDGNKQLVAKLVKVSQNFTNTLQHMAEAIKIREQVVCPDNINLPDASRRPYFCLTPI